MVVVTGAIVKIAQKKISIHGYRFNAANVFGKLAEGF